MSLEKEFNVAVGAGQSGIRINTDEIPDALFTISQSCRKFGWELLVWDLARGLQTADGKPASKPKPKTAAGMPAGLAALQTQDEPPVESALAVVSAFLNRPSGDGEADIVPTVLVMKNLHISFEGSRERMVATVQHLIEDGKEHGKFLVGLMPAEVRLPPEIDPLFHVIEHELPDEDELLTILDQIQTSDERVPLTEEARNSIAKAALGLTRLQAEGAFAASLVQFEEVRAKEVWRHKADILNRDGLVELRESNLSFSSVGGLHGFKDFLRRLLAHDPLQDEDPDAMYKGVAAVGPPGVGKSLMAYCVGNEFNMPTLLANPGNLMNKYVGDTEKNTRRFFQICRRMAPCVVVLDEVGQTMSNGDGDGGSDVANRMLGTFLTQLNDIKDPILWFFTANNVEKMHEAFLRAERVDQKIYVRLPDESQRAEIWKIYLQKFFPRKVKGIDDPLHLELDITEALRAYRRAKTAPNAIVEHAAKLAAALMSYHGEDRETKLREIRDMSAPLADAAQPQLIDDENWTPAEIRSCCRLARRLKMTLAETSARIGHVCIGEKGQKTLRRLDRWALNEGALDAETGRLFQLPEAVPEQTAATTGKKVRRTVKRMKA